MRTIAVANQKGGSGKTTTTVNLAAALAEKKRKVLVLDLDPQAATTSWLGIHEETRELADIFTGKGSISGIIRNTGIEGIDIIPSSYWMVVAVQELAKQGGPYTRLKEEVKKLPGKWDYLLVDCPPALGSLTINGLAAVREILVPIEAHVMALKGLVNLVQTVDWTRNNLTPRLKITGILACRVQTRTRHAQDVIEQLRERFGRTVFKTVIRENIRLAEAPSFGKPITTYANRSNGAADYRSLAREVIRQEGGKH